MKEIVISMVCTFVLAPILAFGIFAVSWWGTAPEQILPPPSHLAPRNTNTTTGPPGGDPSFRPPCGQFLVAVVFGQLCKLSRGGWIWKRRLVLDRPARSFKDGGFSFGNTLRRFVASSPPGFGTPMPGSSAHSPRVNNSRSPVCQSLGRRSSVRSRLDKNGDHRSSRVRGNWPRSDPVYHPIRVDSSLEEPTDSVGSIRRTTCVCSRCDRVVSCNVATGMVAVASRSSHWDA